MWPLGRGQRRKYRECGCCCHGSFGPWSWGHPATGAAGLLLFPHYAIPQTFLAFPDQTDAGLSGTGNAGLGLFGPPRAGPGRLRFAGDLTRLRRAPRACFGRGTPAGSSRAHPCPSQHPELGPSLPSAVYKGCTRDAQGVHKGCSSLRPVCTPGTAGVPPLYTTRGDGESSRVGAGLSLGR